MHETKTTNLRLTWWPTPQDYNEAIQIPQANLFDPELKAGLVYTDAIGLPRPITGSFASVYRMHCPEKDYALRLFLRNLADQEARYKLISDFVQNDDLPYTVTFHFLAQGIKMMGHWLPCLKMEWVEGTHLDDYVVENLANPQKIDELANKFLAMMIDLQRAGIAHGDLQHGNIIVGDGELRLVDYDGMFVPGMEGFQASELGHRNYQHPCRLQHHFGPYLDNFSAWIIYTSLKALAVDSRLMHQLGVGDDCLLFKQADFVEPLHSPAFAALEGHSNSGLRDLGRFIRAQLINDPEAVPYLQALPPAVISELVPLANTAIALRQGPRLQRGSLPDWLDRGNVNSLNAKEEPRTISSLVPKQLGQQSWVVPTNTPVQQWVKPSSYHSSPPVVIPPELQLPAPRRVLFGSTDKTDPNIRQLWMLANPIVWFFVSVLSNVISYSAHSSISPAALLCLLITGSIIAYQEKCIWGQASREIKLAQNGIGVLGKVVGKRVTQAPGKPRTYIVVVACSMEGQRYSHEIIVTRKQYALFYVGKEEVLIWDGNIPGMVAFYSLCSYRPMDI